MVLPFALFGLIFSPNLFEDGISVCIFNLLLILIYMQDDSYLESYISTIGVDFVSAVHYLNTDVSLCVIILIIYV